MTNIQEELKKQKAKLDLYVNKADEESIAIFAGQKESIQKLTGTEWFKHIQLFWIAKEMDAMQEFSNVDPEQKSKVAEIKAKFNLAKEFNSYLNVRLK